MPFGNLSLPRSCYLPRRFTEEESEGVGTGRHPLSILGFQEPRCPNAALCSAAPVWPPWALQAGRPGPREGHQRMPMPLCPLDFLSPRPPLPEPGSSRGPQSEGAQGWKPEVPQPIRRLVLKALRCGGKGWCGSPSPRPPQVHPSCFLVCRLAPPLPQGAGPQARHRHGHGARGKGRLPAGNCGTFTNNLN